MALVASTIVRNDGVAIPIATDGFLVNQDVYTIARDAPNDSLTILIARDGLQATRNDILTIPGIQELCEDGRTHECN